MAKSKRKTAAAKVKKKAKAHTKATAKKKPVKRTKTKGAKTKGVKTKGVNRKNARKTAIARKPHKVAPKVAAPQQSAPVTVPKPVSKTAAPPAAKKGIVDRIESAAAAVVDIFTNADVLHHQLDPGISNEPE
ncbi:MAG: hypothetical protein WAM75_08725 [Xanthobacteraceae bacterium]